MGLAIVCLYEWSCTNERLAGFHFCMELVWHSCTHNVCVFSAKSEESHLIVQCSFLAGEEGGGGKQEGGSMTHNC